MRYPTLTPISCRQIEMIVGGIDEDPSISQYVSSSTSYNQDELTWCVAKAQRKHSFFNFLAGFNATAWLLLLLFILTSSLAVLAAQRVSGFKIYRLHRYLSICLNMLGILVTQAINVNAQSWPVVLRLLFGLAFFMAFFFSNTYQSFLISTLTNPTTEAQISRLEEIYGNRMIIMVSSEHVRHLDKEGEVRIPRLCTLGASSFHQVALSDIQIHTRKVPNLLQHCRVPQPGCG